MDSIDFGICRLSIVPVRHEPSEKAEMVTQLLFGEHYEVLQQSADAKWLRIKIEYDQYEGWIDALQHNTISKEYFEYLDLTEFKITTDITTSILYHKSPQIILMGSMIPISSSELFKMEEQFAFNGEAKNCGQKREFEFLKNTAMKYINAPYLWGGKSPFGIDCSGFTQMVFKISGYNLFRDAWQQGNQGKSIKTFGEAKPGDLVFFKNNENKVVHVGVLLQEDKIIHASGKVRIDHLSEEGIVNLDTKITTHQLSHFRRILAE